MASKRENKIALAKARRERGIISSQNRILDTIKKEEERMAFNQAMGSNVATAKPLTGAQEGRFYEATGLDNASNPEEAIKGEIINTGLSWVQVANALANKAGGNDIVAQGAGQALGRMIPYGTGTMDTGKAIDTYTKWGTGNVTKGDVANLALSGMGIRTAAKGAKGLIPAARSVKASGIPLPVTVGVGGGAGIIRVGGDKPAAGAARSRFLPSGKEKELNRVAEARASEGFIENKPTPEVVGATRFGGAETSKLSPEALEERASTAAEYVSPEELADELSTLENMGFATVDKIPAKSVGAVSLSQKELADRTAAALSGIKKRERAVNAAREARGEEPFEYEPHFDPYDLTKKELETLWGGNPIYVYNAAGELIPELGAHLGHGSGKSLKYGYSATLGSVRGQRGVANMRYGSEF